jgi:2-polyprenyl-3-methyl-5-hydroxy-6-metoxy-1,4-benzoquinol methylase
METSTQSARAQFFVREHCIACNSQDCVTLDEGGYTSGVVGKFFAEDPWGVSPLPSLEGSSWEYVQCRQCGQMFHKRILTPEWNEIRFRDWMSASAIREFERIHGTNTPRSRFEQGRGVVEHVIRIERMTRPLRGQGAVRLVDFGSGWGKFISIASEFGFQAYGIERAPDRQKFSTDRGNAVFPDLKSAREAVGEGFHIATLFQVLEHLDRPLETLLSLGEVLVPKGILVVEVPNCEGIVGLKTKADYTGIHPLEHINAFTPQSLVRIAERAGFRPIRPRIVHVTSAFKSVVRREVKRIARYIMKPETHQYFQKV